VSRVELPAEAGWPMMGYGARVGVAEGQHDALYARGLFLGRGDDAVLLVEADLCLLGVAQCAQVREQISSETGLPRESICIACIHTHSGPETGFAARALGRPLPEWEGVLLEAIARAGVEAHAENEPARLGVGLTHARIGRNRRRDGAASDERVAVLRVDDANGRVRAVLYVHGCHPTALGHDNLAYSADWPGVASAVVEGAFPGALALFGLGAHGDVDPRTRGLQDLTLPDQSRGVSFEAMAELGREVGEAVVACAATIETSADARIEAEVRSVALPIHNVAGGRREEAVEARRRAAMEALGLEPSERLSVRELYRVEHERTGHLPRDAQRERLARVRLYLRDLQAPMFAGGEYVAVEVQQLTLGALELWALPLEVTADVGLALAERAGSALVLPLSIANGWLRYLPHPDHFELPHADEQYEVLNSVFPAEAAGRLLPI
jgi:hypothetical protein